MALVEVETFPDHTVAEMARGMLAAEGIVSVLFDSGLASLGLGRMTPVRLMVDEGDKRRAEQLLADPSA